MQACATNTVKAPAHQVITMKGNAIIRHNATLLARSEAVKQAIRNVSATLGSTASESLLGSTKVVDEWVDGDVYHVQMLATLSSEKGCQAPYRKRLVATAFPVVTSGQVSANESQDLYSGIPREMMNSLMESGDFIGQNKTHTTLYQQPDLAPETSSIINPVIQVASEQGAQFVISGVIRDLEVESTGYIRGAGLLAQVKSVMRDYVARRGVAIDVYVHDGLTGSLLFQHRYTDTVSGDVWIPVGYTVGSERFKSTPTGHKISKIIQLASQDIRQLFSCYPFSAQVIKVEGNKVFFAAGFQNKLKVGDYLAVDAVNSHAKSLHENRRIGVIHITHVQGQFSVGVMEVISDAQKIKAGDLVKSW
ncbi:MAG: hypothetical protein KAG19_05440 [Methylococcales bacterium]|nr:hypothetical protein [Methylococcales bacterium]